MWKKVTEAEALAQDASRRHVLLSFDLGKVEGAGEDEDVHQADEALQEGDRGLQRQALGRFNVLQFMLAVQRRCLFFMFYSSRNQVKFKSKDNFFK